MFVKDVHGKNIPLDIQHSDKGRYIIVNETTYKVTENFKKHHPKEPRYQIHVATCKHPKKWVKK